MKNKNNINNDNKNNISSDRVSRVSRKFYKLSRLNSLSVDEIEELFFMYRSGKYSVREMAEWFGVERSTIERRIAHMNIPYNFNKWRGNNYDWY